MVSSDNSSGIKVVGSIELPEIKKENARLEAAGTTTRVLPNGMYVIDQTRKWQVGSIIFFDSQTNHFGKIAIKAKRFSAINFNEASKLSKIHISAGDMVIFCTERGLVKEVIPAWKVSNLPWSMILSHVGFYKEIEFTHTIDRKYNRKQTITVPVIKTFLSYLKEADTPAMLSALYEHLESIESEQEREEYIDEVLGYGVQKVFGEKCLNHEYAESLLAEDSPYLGQYFEIVTAIVRKLIEKGDLAAVAKHYVTFKGLDETYGDFIQALNGMAGDWQKLTVIISAFVRGMKSDFSSRELLGERMDDREWCRPSSIKLDEDFIILDILERSVRIASIPFCAPVLKAPVIPAKESIPEQVAINLATKLELSLPEMPVLLIFIDSRKLACVVL